MTDSAALIGVVALVAISLVAVVAVVTMGQVAAGRGRSPRRRSWRDVAAAVVWVATILSAVVAIASYVRG